MNKAKQVLKDIISYKKIFIGEASKHCYINPKSKIEGYKKIFMKSYSSIGKDVWIGAYGNRSKIVLNKNVNIKDRTTIYVKDCELLIDENSFLNGDCTIMAESDVKIGKNVMIAPKCNIIATNHKYDDLNIDMIYQGLDSKGIIIEDNVWIGINVTILDGVTIKSGSIIAAGAVVTKDTQSNSIYGGIPAKFIKKR